MASKKYFFIFMGIFAAVLTGVGFFNWLVNPFCVYNSPTITGFNKKKICSLQLRLAIPYLITHKNPRALILGSSRVGGGISTSRYPAFKGTTAYNAALPAASLYEILRIMQHACSTSNLESVFLCLDFFCYGIGKTAWPSFIDSRLLGSPEVSMSDYYHNYLRDSLMALFAYDSLKGSIDTIRKQDLKEGFQIYPDGSWGRYPRDRKTPFIKTNRKKFVYIDKLVLNDLKSSFQRDPDVMAEYHDLYRQLLKLAHENNIKLYLFVPPTHARHLETVRSSGLWDLFQNWKRNLVAINAKQAALASRAPFPLWDFSGYNSITTERLPQPNQKGEILMLGFKDSSHFTIKTGEIILNRLLNYDTATISKDFGVCLTSANIETHLEQTNKQQALYIENNSEEIEEIQELYRQMNSADKNNNSRK
jgi:hypothetical protein